MKINAWAVPGTQLDWNPHIQEIIQKVGQKTFGNLKAIGISSNEDTIGHKQPRAEQTAEVLADGVMLFSMVDIIKEHGSLPHIVSCKIPPQANRQYM
eukprot:832923-Ditylum_brightwellii.AAC.1